MSKQRYKVCVWETVGGFLEVEIGDKVEEEIVEELGFATVENEEQAGEYIQALVDYFSLASPKIGYLDTTHREAEVCGVESI